MRGLAIIGCLLLAGCSGIDRSAQERIDSAKKLLSTSPEQALAQLAPVLDQYPKHVRARRLQALALEASGDTQGAIDAWGYVINSHSSQSERLLLDAHTRFSRLTLAELGDLPDRVVESPQGVERERIVALQTSLNFLLENAPDDRFALLSKAGCLYRLGPPNQPLPVIARVVELYPGDEPALFLQALAQEQMEPRDPQALATYFHLAQSESEETRRVVAKHLIFLASAETTDAESRENVRGVLLRMLRDRDSAPEVLLGWDREHGSAERDRIEAHRLDLQFHEIDALVAAGEYQQAWWVLDEMPLQHPGAKEKRKEVAEAWARRLVDKGSERLAARRLDEARDARKALDAVPSELLSTALAERVQRFTQDLGSVDRTLQVKLGLGRAEEALRRRQPQEALTHLEGLEALATGGDRDELFLLRAHALLDWGDRKGALQAFDKVTKLKEIADKRSYALLLVENGRAEEATEFLDLLPIGAMRGEVLDALIESLEKQGKWESILARLSDLTPLPKRLIPVRRRASTEAADRWIRIGNSERAMRVLRSYLEPAELEQPPIIGLYLQAAIRTGETATAKRLLLDGDARRFATLPPEVVLEGVERLGGSITEQERYALLQRLERMGHVGGEEVETRLAQMAPRFGRYLPAPGTYDVRYRITETLADSDGEEVRSLSVTWRWEGERFLVEGDGFPAESWWVEDDIWHRETPEGELLIPVRVEGGPPLPRTTFPLRGFDAGAEIVEAGTRVTVGDTTYEGCLRVRIITGGAEQEQILLDLAPDRGEVRREVMRAGKRVALWEMTLLAAQP